jgi:small GTP-binding protein
MNHTPPDNQPYSRAMQTVQRTLGDLASCTPAEREQLAAEARQLEAMTAKLEVGRVDIAVVGEISTGKSALINALVGQARTEVDVRGGWTRQAWHVPWDAAGYVMPGLADSSVVLIDTPGLNEVDGAQRAQIADQTARHADLILFVTDSDLNHVEFTALKLLAEAGKPLIVALNKADLYTPAQLTELRATLTARLASLVAPDDIVTTAADPRTVEVVVESPAASPRTEHRQPLPQIEPLKLRILELLDREGKALAALNAALYAADASDRIAAVKIRLRDQAARRLIWSYAASKAVAAAANPVPVLDVVGGSVVDAGMVVALARLYRIRMTTAHASKLINAILQAAGWVTLAEIATHVGSSLLKGLTFGLSTLITAPMQGAAAGYGSFIVGHAAKYYFEHGASWGGRSPKAVVREIIDAADRASVLDGLKQEIRRRLTRNPHARDAGTGDRGTDGAASS